MLTRKKKKKTSRSYKKKEAKLKSIRLRQTAEVAFSMHALALASTEQCNLQTSAFRLGLCLRLNQNAWQNL